MAEKEKDVEILDPEAEAYKEFQEEEKAKADGTQKEDLDIKKKVKDAPEKEETVEKEEEESESESAKKEDEEEKVEAEKNELSKKAKELGLDENASKEDIEKAEKADAAKTARDEKIKALSLKEDASEEDIQAAEEKAQKDAFEAEVKEYAETENVTIDEARKHLEGISGVLKKYENNPKKLAKAYRSQQSEFSRLQAENAQLKKAEPKVIVLSETEFAVGNRVFSKDKVVEIYRKEHPAETEELEDAQVFLMAKGVFEAQVEKAYSEHEKKLSRDAVVKRQDILDNLGEGDKKFLSEIKTVLEAHSDDMVMSDKFDITDITKWVKGAKYEELVKQHKDELKSEYQRGFKAGQENSRVKLPGGTPPKGKGKAQLNDTEKKEALSMYGGSMTEEEAYEAFIEVGLEEFRKEHKK